MNNPASLRFILLAGFLYFSLFTSAQLTKDSIEPILKRTEQWLVSRKDSLRPATLLALQRLYAQKGFQISGLDPCVLLRQRKADGIIHARASIEGCLMGTVPLKGKLPKTPFEKLAYGVYLFPSAYSQDDLVSSVFTLINTSEAPLVDMMYLMRFALKKEIVSEFSYRYDSLQALLSSKVVNSIENPRNSFEMRIETYVAAIQTGLLNQIHWRWIKNLKQLQLPDGSFSSGGGSKMSSEQCTVAAFILLHHTIEMQKVVPDDTKNRKK